MGSGRNGTIEVGAETERGRLMVLISSQLDRRKGLVDVASSIWHKGPTKAQELSSADIPSNNDVHKASEHAVTTV